MIRTGKLTKQYRDVLALDAVDLEVPAGSVYGLIGPNGAGKTTLLGILAGLRRPTSGSVTIDVSPSEIAVLPDTPRFDSWLTAREVIDLARTIGTNPAPADRVEILLNEAGLAEAADRPVKGFSRGMLQRLGLAATIVNEPQLLLLDEPSSALDPIGRREVLDLVSRLRGESTVVFSSHILADVQEVCDTVGILRNGRLAYQGSVAHLLSERTTPRYLVRLRPPIEQTVEALRQADWVVAVNQLGPDQVRIEATSVAEAESSLAAVLAQAQAKVVSLVPEAATLEDVVLEIVT
jgi:ABC-2 type transport system ATP-binding protein